MALTLLGIAWVLLLLFWRATLPAVFAGSLSTQGQSLVFWVFLTTLLITANVFGALIFFPGVALIQGTATIWRGIVGLTALTFDGTIKAWVWGFTKALSLGLSGAPRRVKDVSVEQMLRDGDDEDCIYLELPADIVDGVLRDQQAQFTDIQDILYRKTANWLPTHIQEHLESLDFPLVHTVYYRDASCIQKIADWIQEEVVKDFDGRSKYSATVSLGSFKGGVFQTQGEFEGPNDYRFHVEKLKRKYGPPGSRWGAATNFDKAYALHRPNDAAVT